MIPVEAVEAAAKVILRSFRPAHPEWDEWTVDGQEMWKEYAREALEAAAPHMLEAQQVAAIRHHLRGDNWASGETPRHSQPILDILDGVAE